MLAASFDVVMLSTAHPATNHRIFFREARTLAQAGFSVAVVAKHPVSEVIDGVSVVALPTAKTRLRRLLLGWTALKAAWRMQGNMYIFHDPELFGVGLLLRLLGKAVVYDAHENLPRLVLQKEWIPVILRYTLCPVLYLVEWIGSRLLSGVIVAVPVMQKRFPRSRTVLVRNYPTPEALRTLGFGPPLRSRDNVAIYAGGLTAIRGIRELVQAFRGLDNAELLLVGNFDSTAFKNELLAAAPPNVHWLGLKSHTEVLELYHAAKLGINLLYPTPNHRMSLPVKLFEYLGAGLPVIASDFPEFREVVEGCGIQVDPHDVAAIRTAIQRLLADNTVLEEMSVRARARVLACYSWEPEAQRLIDFCRQRIGMRRAASQRLPASPVRDPKRSFVHAD